MVDLRSFVFLDSLQPQHAAFLGTVAKGFLPVRGQASLFIEIAPGIEINRLTDIAVKATSVKPGMQIVERLYGLLELHHDEQAEVRRAGEAILKEIGAEESSRIKPEILSSTVIRHLDDRQTQLMRTGLACAPSRPDREARPRGPAEWPERLRSDRSIPAPPARSGGVVVPGMQPEPVSRG